VAADVDRGFARHDEKILGAVHGLGIRQELRFRSAAESSQFMHGPSNLGRKLPQPVEVHLSHGAR
jgi:hypothetical protein